MAMDKNREQRITVIAEILNTRKECTLVEIRNEVAKDLNLANITTRTINRDLKYLNEFRDAQIQEIGAGKNTRYAVMNAIELFSSTLDTEQKEDLALLYGIFTSMPYLKDVMNYEQLFKSVSKHYKSLQKNPPISFEPIYGDAKIGKHLEVILNSIINNITITIEYKSFKQNDVDTVVFHPYFLKQFNKRWWVIGMIEIEGVQYLQNRALDRIVSVKRNRTSIIDKALYISPSAYNEHTYGITKTSLVKLPKDEMPTIIFNIKKDRAPFIASKPLQPNMKQKVLNNGSSNFSFTAIINHELVNELLSYGADCTVLEPLALRTLMQAKAKEMLKNYKAEKL
jgi:predicted DNA-binding transcriptional regulator YafY